MPKRVAALFSSSIGKKALMSVTGLGLIGFLIAHVAGNLKLWADPDGRAFDAYAAGLQGLGPLLVVGEVGLALLFLAHVGLGVRVTLENRAARRQRYAVSASGGERTFASSTMIVTGVIVLAFVIVHLLDFRLREPAPDGLAAMVVRRLSEPVGAGIYLVGVVALGVHLTHAFRSALQTLGIEHPRYDTTIRRAGTALALALTIGFATFPVLLLAGSRGHQSARAAAGARSGAEPAPVPHREAPAHADEPTTAREALR